MSNTLALFLMLGPSIVLMVQGRSWLHTYRLAHPGVNIWPHALALMAGIAALPFLILGLVFPIFGINIPW